MVKSELHFIPVCSLNQFLDYSIPAPLTGGSISFVAPSFQAFPSQPGQAGAIQVFALLLLAPHGCWNVKEQL